MRLLAHPVGALERWTLLPWALAWMVLSACGNDAIVATDGFDRLAAVRLCIENDDPFDGLELRVVPGPEQTPPGEGPGCVRLRFQRGGTAPPGLDLVLEDGLVLVEGERRSGSACRLGESEGEVAALSGVRGSARLDDERVDVEVELDFADGARIEVEAEQVLILQRNCGGEL